MSISPRDTSMCTHRATAPFVQDQTTPMVSGSHAPPVVGSATPPHRSTTVSPSSVTQNDAPISPRSARLRSNSSRTDAKRGSQVPCTVIVSPFSCGTDAASNGFSKCLPAGRVGRVRRVDGDAVDLVAVAGVERGPDLVRLADDRERSEHVVVDERAHLPPVAPSRQAVQLVAQVGPAVMVE